LPAIRSLADARSLARTSEWHVIVGVQDIASSFPRRDGSLRGSGIGADARGCDGRRREAIPVFFGSTEAPIEKNFLPFTRRLGGRNGPCRMMRARLHRERCNVEAHRVGQVP
jgi:hypothetical protein